MTVALPLSAPVDFDTWLQLEEKASTKHELVSGELFAMAGASMNHNEVAGAFLERLRPAAREGGCRALGSDMAVQAGTNGYYPDVVVTCEPPPRDRHLIAPCTIVEVSSPSTAAIDRREKRAAYCALPSLQAYVIAEANHPHVETYLRRPNGWEHRIFGPGEFFTLPCPDVLLAVDDLYAGIE